MCISAHAKEDFFCLHVQVYPFRIKKEREQKLTWHVCRVRGSWRNIPRMVGARRERREWTRRKGTRREWTGREDARREGAGRENTRWEDTGGKDARRERVRRRQKAQSSWRR